MTMKTNNQQLASLSGITMDYLAEMIRSEIRGLEGRMIKRWNDMDSMMIEDGRVTTNSFAIETKDKETAETNDNNIEKIEKVEVSKAIEIIEENEDKEADVEKVEKTEVSTATEIIEENEDKEAVRETETKDKEAAENNDNYAEKVEKDEIIGGFSTSGVSTDDTEVNGTLNIFDPNIRDKGGGRKDRPEKNKLQSN